MELNKLRSVLDSASGRSPADIVFKNAYIVDVFNKEIFISDLYVKDGIITGFGDENFPSPREIIDCSGKYIVPGFIDSHVHIESSHSSPSAFSDAIVPQGTTTIIADPHEICNVSGISGLDYMLEATENTPLQAFFMIPSCVPATSSEHSGAIIDANSIASRINHERVLGLGEMMNYPGVIWGDEEVLKKILVAKGVKKVVDGHSPGIEKGELDAYSSSGILTDHECETPSELVQRIKRGMYVMLRQGSACKNVIPLLKGVTKSNIEYCLFCTDDKQPESILKEGHINYNVNISIDAGMNPIDAIAIATINAAKCYNLKDRGAIAPGRRADFLITKGLEKIIPEKVYIGGSLVAENGKIVEPSIAIEPKGVASVMDVKNFTKASLALNIKNPHVRVIDIIPGGVLTKKGEAHVTIEHGVWVHNNHQDILKLVVIERHHGTGYIGKALIRGYGLNHGAVGTTIAHDSHNIIVIGDNDEDMSIVVNSLISIGGGISMAKNGKVIGSLAHPIAGLMSDKSLPEVHSSMVKLHTLAFEEFNIHKNIDPFMTLSFMALPVIPELKLTDMGLFDVTTFSFTELEIE